MIVEVPADYYTYSCWCCHNTIKVKITTIQDMIKQAKEKGWEVKEGRCLCGKCRED